MCGEKVTTWEKLSRVYRLFDLASSSKHSYLSYIFEEQLHYGPKSVFNAYWRDVMSYQWAKVGAFRTFQEKLAKSGSIETKLVLERSRISHCSRPEDRVYCVLGLLHPSLAAQVRINYHASISQIYLAFTRAWIIAENSLDVLAECGNEHSDELSKDDMPSWVPYLQRHKRMLTSAIEPDYNAHSRSDAVVHFSADGQRLAAKGILLDVVVGVSDIFRSNQSDRVEINHIHEHTFRGMESASPNSYTSAYGYPIHTTEALWRALLGGRDLAGRALWKHHACVLSAKVLEDGAYRVPRDGGSWETVFAEAHSFFTQNSTFGICGWQLHEWFTKDRSNLTDQVYRDALRRLNSFMWSRRLATTKWGFVGVLPGSARVHDVVAVFYGCSCPILLRPFGDKFKVVSPCYIQGVMDGEAVNRASGARAPFGRKLQSTTIELM